MSNTKNILTGHVHRLVDGVLESHAPGEPAPDWVTNTELIGVADTTPADTADTGTTPGVDDGDGLDALSGTELKEVAGELDVAKSGSKADLIARIRAKRAAGADNHDDDAADRDSLIEQAKALGIEVDENQSEVELQALIDAAKE